MKEALIRSEAHPCVPEITLFLSLNTSQGNTSIRKSQKKNFPVLSDSLCTRKKEMPHPPEARVLNANPTELGFLPEGSAARQLALQQAQLLELCCAPGWQLSQSSARLPFCKAPLGRALPRTAPRTAHCPCRKMRPGVNQ